MDTGFISLDRKILDWPWWRHPVTRDIFILLLLTVNWEDRQWKGIIVKRGQRVVSNEILAQESGFTTAQARRAMTNLKRTGELAYQWHNNFGLVTVINYDRYQQAHRPTSSDRSSDAQATAQAKKVVYKNARDRTINNRTINNRTSLFDSGVADAPPTPSQTTKDFFQMVDDQGEQYDSFVSQLALSANVEVEKVRGELDKFSNYWRERTRNGKHERWETEKTFEVQRRLNTWFSRIRDQRPSKEPVIIP